MMLRGAAASGENKKTRREAGCMSLVFVRVDLACAQLHLPRASRVMMMVHVVDAGEHDEAQRSPAQSVMSTGAGFGRSGSRPPSARLRLAGGYLWRAVRVAIGPQDDRRSAIQ
ncbi:MAG: hypothetical protein AB7Q29_03070 [Vicinamibacterales bacterium]